MKNVENWKSYKNEYWEAVPEPSSLTLLRVVLWPYWALCGVWMCRWVNVCSSRSHDVTLHSSLCITWPYHANLLLLVFFPHYFLWYTYSLLYPFLLLHSDHSELTTSVAQRARSRLIHKRCGLDYCCGKF